MDFTKIDCNNCVYMEIWISLGGKYNNYIGCLDCYEKNDELEKQKEYFERGNRKITEFLNIKNHI